MNEQQILELAHANGWESYFDTEGFDLIKFAALVAAHEREECAKICDAYGMPDGTSPTAALLAKAIRARDKTVLSVGGIKE